MKEKIKQLDLEIKKAKNIALFTHIRMDPDTFGSATAFYYILEKLWKNVILLNDEKVPDDFAFLWANDVINTNWNLEKFKADLAISLDAADTKQLGNSYLNNKSILEKIPFFVIDHHITNPWFWKINIIDTNSSSTCELLFNILKEINLVKFIDKKISTLLIAGILTDTNIFYNTNVTPITHKVASELLKLWADSRTCIFNFFKKKSLLKTKVLARWLSKIEVISPLLVSPKGREVATELKNKNIIYTTLNKSDLEELWATDKETNWIIEHLINIENCEIAFIIYPIKWNINKVSFRSHSYDVSQLAQKFWWWWHKQASGFSSEKDINTIIKEILNNI